MRPARFHIRRSFKNITTSCPAKPAAAVSCCWGLPNAEPGSKTTMTTNISRYVCANVGCGEDGKLRCKKCQLVCVSLVRHTREDWRTTRLTTNSTKYCGVSCQREHWTSHKLDCNSPLLKSTWRPQWEAEGRKPAFMTSDAPARSFNHHKKYLWGNMPAFDVLKLEANEGKGYKGDLDLLFAGIVPLSNHLGVFHDPMFNENC